MWLCTQCHIAVEGCVTITWSAQVYAGVICFATTQTTCKGFKVSCLKRVATRTPKKREEQKNECFRNYYYSHMQWARCEPQTRIHFVRRFFCSCCSETPLRWQTNRNAFLRSSLSSLDATTFAIVVVANAKRSVLSLQWHRARSRHSQYAKQTRKTISLRKSCVCGVS